MEDTTPIDQFPADIVFSCDGRFIAWVENLKTTYSLMLSSTSNLWDRKQIVSCNFPHGIGDVVFNTCSCGANYLLWAESAERRWRIRLLCIETGNIVTPVPGNRVARLPQLLRLVDEILLLVWWDLTDKFPAIWACRIRVDGSLKTPPQQLSPRGVFTCRPRLAPCSDNDSALLTYDIYEKDCYRVKVVTTNGKDIGKHIEPFKGRGDIFAPEICTMNNKVVISALHQNDVVSSEGVVDHHPQILVAFTDDLLTYAHWQEMEKPAIDLSYGLIAALGEPNESVLGYLGRRRHAEFVKISEEKVWLCWEVKSRSDAWARHGRGSLFGRPVEGLNLGSVYNLHNGFRLYAATGDTYMADQMIVAGRGAVEDGKMPLLIETINVNHVPVCSLPSASPKWQPITLPVDIDDRPEQRWQKEQGSNEYTLYWGDVHVHTGASSDGDGELDELFHYARDKAKLDFVVFQDNDCYLLRITGHDYNTSLLPAQRWSRDREFIVMPGWECTSHPCNNDYNHRTCIFLNDNPFLLHWPDIRGNTELLVHIVQQAGGLAHPHHNKWKLFPNETETNIEIVSGWEASFALETEWIHRPLNEGKRLGFVGGSDNHRFNPGLGGALTGIWIKELTREEIIRAFKAHRCFATTGSRISLYCTVNTRLMGELVEIQTGKPLYMELEVQAPDIIEEVLLIGDGHKLRIFEGKGKNNCSCSFEMPAQKGRHWIYWKVTLKSSEPELPMNLSVARGRYAWTSPMWIIGI